MAEPVADRDITAALAALTKARALLDDTDATPLGKIGAVLDKITVHVDAAIRAIAGKAVQQ